MGIEVIEHTEDDAVFTANLCPNFKKHIDERIPIFCKRYIENK